MKIPSTRRSPASERNPIPRGILVASVAGTLFFPFALVLRAQEEGEAAAAPKPVGGAMVRPDEKTLEMEFVIREKLDLFFEGIRDEDVEKAFGDLLLGSKIGERKENLDGLVNSTLGVLEKFGKLEEFEMIRAKRVGARTVRFSYLSYGPDFPLLWNFYCYRGGEKWQILDITVNNDPDQIFGETTEPGTEEP